MTEVGRLLRKGGGGTSGPHMFSPASLRASGSSPSLSTPRSCPWTHVPAASPSSEFWPEAAGAHSPAGQGAAAAENRCLCPGGGGVAKSQGRRWWLEAPGPSPQAAGWCSARPRLRELAPFSVLSPLPGGTRVIRTSGPQAGKRSQGQTVEHRPGGAGQEFPLHLGL